MERQSVPFWAAIRTRHVFTVIVLASALFVLYLARDALGPYIFAVVMAYLILPIVSRIELALPEGGRLGRIKRPVATLLSLLITAVVLILLLTFVAKPVVDDLQELATNFSAYWTDLTEGQEFGDWYEDNVPVEIQSWIADHVGEIGQQLLNAIAGVLSFLVNTTGSALGAAFTMIIVPVFMVYFLIDRPGTERLIRTLLPESWTDDSIAVLRFSDQIMAMYTRGVIVTSAIVGVITGFGYWLIGVDLWVALGAIAFVGEIVPILGPWIAFFISFPIILVTQPDKALLAALVFGAVQAIEGWYLSPKIQGDSIQLPASLILLSLAIGGAVAGAIGVVLVLPAVAILRALVVYTMRRLDGIPPDSASLHLVTGLVDPLDPGSISGIASED